MRVNSLLVDVQVMVSLLPLMALLMRVSGWKVK